MFFVLDVSGDSGSVAERWQGAAGLRAGWFESSGRLDSKLAFATWWLGDFVA